MTIAERLRGVARRLAELSPLDVALGMTLVLVLARPGPTDPWYLVASTTMVAAVALLVPDLARRPATWFVLAACYFLGNNVIRYELVDNHKFLTSYWCLAIGLALTRRDAAGTLAESGRILAGLVFALATVQKLLSPSYTSGAMFEQLLLLDERFFSLAYLLGDGFGAEEALRNRGLLEAALRGFIPSVTLVGADGVRGAAMFLTVWTVVIEGAIALLFLLPPRWRAAGWRDAVLLAFVITTYPPTSVIQFGWLILAMGAAATRVEQRTRRLAYIGAFLFILVFSTGQLRALLFESARYG